MNKYLDEIIKNLKTLISFPSVQGDAEKDMPFGKGTYDALNFTLSLANSLGFETKNYDNYIGEAIFGDGDEEMAILVHLDVVPVGDEKAWKYPPFSATEADGKIYGRGATDDKGSALTCLYALKALKDEGFMPNKKIKLIFGCNEESGWACIDHYKSCQKMPDFGFSPDADFPVIYAEKGILSVRFCFDSKNIISMSGGERVNVVCDLAKAKISLPVSDCPLEIKDGEIISHGVSAHGSTPEKGKNAILPLITYLEKKGCVDSKIRKYLFEDKLGLKTLSDETGHLTLSPDILEYKDGKVFVSVDIRYPSTMQKKKICDILDKIAPYEELSHSAPLFSDKNGKLVQTLLRVYNEYTGKKEKPIAIGGGTYARALKFGVAFGPETDEDCAIHQPNEFVSIKNLEMQFEIYKRAIKELTK